LNEIGNNYVRTRVKICGITRPEDGLVAARHGADAIGLVFYDKSPRSVELSAAQEIVSALPPFVDVVALFVNEQEARIREVLSSIPIDLIQFHGDEPAEFCSRFGRRYIKAIQMRENTDLAQVCEQYSGASGILLDTYKKDVPGGTGESFQWSLVPKNLTKPIILAGGLSPDNVVAAITQVNPYAVDVSSGVEKAKGVKDEDRIAALIRGVTSV
jgi:phosphoribosylanthranilate isomerase